jgi:glyoxylase-like metal-dependent hydrolase (beta-lactamase superfamily II)
MELKVLASQATSEDIQTGAGAGFSAGGASGGEPIRVDEFLQEGDQLGPWQVLETPGHARGHLCFFDPASRVLVCGDMCAGEGTILIEPSQGDMGLYLSSLERLASLEPRLAIPAHGQPLADAGVALRALRDHRLGREQKVLMALQGRGPTPINELTPQAYADADPRVWPLAELSVESHLLKLAKDGRAHRTEDGWVAVDD